MQTSNLKFSSSIVGTWYFNLQGTGLPPTTMETTIFVATIESGEDEIGLQARHEVEKSQVVKGSENLKVVNVLDRDVSVSFRTVSDKSQDSGMLSLVFFVLICSRYFRYLHGQVTDKIGWCSISARIIFPSKSNRKG